MSTRWLVCRLGVCTRSHASSPQITRHKAASVTFGNDLADITDSEKIKHGLLVNFGKNIARQVSSLCASAMQVYPNEKHFPETMAISFIKQLYAINAVSFRWKYWVQSLPGFLQWAKKRPEAKTAESGISYNKNRFITIHNGYGWRNSHRLNVQPR